MRQFELVFNPANSQPIVMAVAASKGNKKVHTKEIYHITEASRNVLKGCTDDMCQASLFLYVSFLHRH